MAAVKKNYDKHLCCLRSYVLVLKFWSTNIFNRQIPKTSLQGGCSSWVKNWLVSLPPFHSYQFLKMMQRTQWWFYNLGLNVYNRKPSQTGGSFSISCWLNRVGCGFFLWLILQLKQATHHLQAVILPEGASSVIYFSTFVRFHHLNLKFRVTVCVRGGTLDAAAQHKHSNIMTMRLHLLKRQSSQSQIPLRIIWARIKTLYI